MQRLWQAKVGWDDPIPESELADWDRWCSGLSTMSQIRLSTMSQIKIPRCYIKFQVEVQEITLHHFSDASEKGYGMCAYLRMVYQDGSISCSFLLGRSRCAPLRSMSIPRLELQAAALSVKMYLTVKEELTYQIHNVVFWTDSMTVLQYIKNESKRFHVYVANRIADIRDATSPQQWRHCPGILNPADYASRGLTPQKVSSQDCWWSGPEFLWKVECQWPDGTVKPLSESDPEIRKGGQHQVCQVLAKPKDTGNDQEGISKLHGLSRVIHHYLWFLGISVEGGCLVAPFL
jgi:hypothetical protein